jgi:hypothetical protein
MSDDYYGLLLPFDTDEFEFARGFECGTAFTLVRATPPDQEVELVLHPENAEMALRIAEACRRTAQSEPLVDEHEDITHIVVSFSKQQP